MERNVPNRSLFFNVPLEDQPAAREALRAIAKDYDDTIALLDRQIRLLELEIELLKLKQTVAEPIIVLPQPYIPPQFPPYNPWDSYPPVYPDNPFRWPTIWCNTKTTTGTDPDMHKPTTSNKTKL